MQGERYSFLRYRTGDIATGGITTEPCPNCKRTVPRILGDIERTALFYELKGKDGPVTLNGNQLRKQMFAREEVLLWYAEIVSNGSEDLMKVVVKGTSNSDEAALLKALETELGAEFKVPITVESSTLDAVANKVGLERLITEQTIFDTRNS